MNPLWDRVTGWFNSNAQHVTVEFIPYPGGSPINAYQGYLRLWLAEGFLAKAATWGNKHFPVLHGGAALSYLGLGVQPPMASWGTLIAEGVGQINPVRIYWWLILFPGGILVTTLLALNFLGDGLRDAWDIKNRP